MYKDAAVVRDSHRVAMEMAKKIDDGVGLVGYGSVMLIDGDGFLKEIEPFANLITTAGDEYYAKKGIAGISPANPAAPTAAVCMKLGTGTTAATKSGAAAALITYLTASNKAFDTGFPTATAAGGDTGWNANYKTTWNAGEATNAAITEAVIANDNANATSTAANTYARIVFAAKNKTADDTLAITWAHKFLGA